MDPTPDESVADTIRPVSISSEPTLDPQISSLLDSLEKRTVRNTVCRFLESLRFVEPQLAMDQKIVVDRESLLAYLAEHDANSIDEICGTVPNLCGIVSAITVHRRSPGFSCRSTPSPQARLASLRITVVAQDGENEER